MTFVLPSLVVSTMIRARVLSVSLPISLCVLSACIPTDITGELDIEPEGQGQPVPPNNQNPPPPSNTPTPMRVCGDGTCQAGEACTDCPEDCGACAPSCGDGTCGADETCTNCPGDCGACPSVCGDGTCAADESCNACQADCGSCDVPTEWADEEQALLELINAQRAQGANCGGRQFGAAGPLRMNNELREAARGHSQDMADQNYFDHDSLDGRSPWDRAADANYQGMAIGENIAAGNQGASGTFQQWLTSPGHCSNMMNASAEETGLGYGYNTGSRYRHYWTQVTGR